MPIIRKIKSACEYYHIPYPMDRQDLQALFTAVMYQHPESKGVCNLSKVVCGTCLYYTSRNGCTYEWGRGKPHRIATYYEPCANCPQYCVLPEIYLLDLKPEDLRFPL